MFILLFGALLIGWLFLSVWEEKRKTRVFARVRTQLDERVAHVFSIAQQVDLMSASRKALGTLIERVAHDLLHLALQAIRFVERLLTRLVRYFRGRQASAPAKTEGGSLFVRTISDFKTGLREASPRRPETNGRAMG